MARFGQDESGVEVDSARMCQLILLTGTYPGENRSRTCNDDRMVVRSIGSYWPLSVPHSYARNFLQQRTR